MEKVREFCNSFDLNIILKIVADNIEGGLQTIQGRLKRYEKDI